MPDPEIRLGEALTEECKKVGGYPLVQLFRGEGDVLEAWKDNDIVSGHLIEGHYTNNWFSEMLDKEVRQCFDPGGNFNEKYFVGPRGRLLRLAVKDGSYQPSPQCYGLGFLFMVLDGGGAAIKNWVEEVEFLYYRGATQYPFWRDPTDPDKGGSGYDAFTTWAFKRGSGGFVGGCANGLTGHCGDLSGQSVGHGQILATGAIVDGVITGFPANESFTELVNYTVSITGCCVDFHDECPARLDECFISPVSYYFCVYPEGVDPTNNPGP